MSSFHFLENFKIIKFILDHANFQLVIILKRKEIKQLANKAHTHSMTMFKGT